MSLNKSTLESSIKSKLESALKTNFKKGKLDKDELKKSLGDNVKNSTKKGKKITDDPANYIPKTKEELLLKVQAETLNTQTKLITKTENEYTEMSGKLNSIINSNDNEVIGNYRPYKQQCKRNKSILKVVPSIDIKLSGNYIIIGL